ncbi:MAG: ATP phosphoribosyltransferase regulatory subunit [Candidatus Peribacteria bacterium]|nr:MAG: ATP phosphoribosyltransferase regulatory subunit [Candidatus Peribacteria bacterium]
MDELETVTSLVAQLATAWQVPLNLTVDAAIVRGLDYYTGTVFETFLDTMPSYGSVCSGGRYEHLTQHLDAKRIFLV